MPGVNGDNGDNGDPGASAYEVAVSGGFIGTEAEWLESLVGADGASVSYAGDWSDVITYVSGDIVRYVPAVAAVSGEPEPQEIAYIYISLQGSNLGNAPDESPSFWALLVQDGANGATGNTGDTGLEGPTGPAGLTVTQNFYVTSSGTSAYIIDGASNPTLTLVTGRTYFFTVNASGHPFYIKTAAVTGTGSTYDDGVIGNGTQFGGIEFTVPITAPSTLYYICQFHAAMVGTINIIGDSAGT
jgi:hypothetical protein